ncbi:gamma-glutamyl-phosphate reductase, partial [Erwinia amylovora]|nr:gamma-glutamyl-phosphate reductase [Erwinia amylovora]
VITGGSGVCHIYVDRSIEPEAALKVIVKAKKQRPSACNSLETLLIDAAIADSVLPALSARMAQEGVSLHADVRSLPLLQQGPAS